jgi:hypothetical protein
MAILVGEKDKLASQTARRSRIDIKAAAIVQVVEPLFTDKELMDELYTPLVRDLVLPETFVPDKYSATQKMIDGSDDYYIKECKSKGKPMPTGAAAFAKGAINLGAQVAGTVLGAMGPVKEGQQALGTSGKLSKEWVARAGDITDGIAALLTGAVDVVDQIDDLRNTGDFSVGGYDTVLNKLALGLGKIVAGSTGDMGLGLAVTDTITGAAALTKIAGEIAVWKKKGGEFPLDKMFSLVGDAISMGLSAASDQTADTADAKVSTHFAQAGQAAKTLFETIGSGVKANLFEAIRAGNWGAVYDFISKTAVEVGKQLPAQIYLDEQYNTKTAYADKKLVAASLGSVGDNVGKGGQAIAGMVGDAGSAAGDALGRQTGASLPQTAQQQRAAEIEAAFRKRKEELDKAAEDASKNEVKGIEEQMKKEQEAFQKSLKCLGSEKPDDADFKSIAKLIEQLERDRRIWDGLTALFGTGIGAASGMAVAMTVAAEVAPALKAAGQLVKYCINLKAAADRCAAWLNWREGRKDAESAVSPYATSIDNFTKNQGQQFTHYSIQAASNAIQALLACGEMSPMAPAFKAAGGGVAAAAAAEDLIYQFYKRQALRNAWKMTRQALDPKNHGNRKMALLVRQMNPTLAKYTLAYGALVEESPVAITACNRIGIDRETLARSSANVDQLKTYFEKLYPDDGSVVGVLDVTPGKTKVPAPALTAKTWALSMMIWKEEHGLATQNSPVIVSHLSIAEARLAKSKRTEDKTEQLIESLRTLWTAFAAFEAVDSNGKQIAAIQRAVREYADLAECKMIAVQMEADADA